MKTILKAATSVLLAATLAVGSVSMVSAAKVKAKASGIIVNVPLKNTGKDGKVTYKSNALAYVPSGVEFGSRVSYTPVLVVYGDKRFTSASALKEADNSGLGSIAKSEEAVVLFVNPVGSKWSKADADSLAAVGNAYYYGDTTYVNGKTKDGLLPGGGESTYVFAEGSGADFADSYLLTGSAIPTAVLLDNVKSPVNVGNDKLEVPAYIVNGTSDIYNTFKKLDAKCGKIGMQTSKITNDFDKAAIQTGYTNVLRTATRHRNVIVDIPRYSKLGINVKHEYTPFFDSKIEYFTYMPNQIVKSKNGTIPLVLSFHGFNLCAEINAWGTEWPLMAKQDGFLYVSVNRHIGYSVSDMDDLLHYLEREYPMIDKTRVYASGFSMGSMKTWGLGDDFSSDFAGIIPTNGCFNAPDSTSNLIMPTFYDAAEQSFLPELPHQKSDSMGDDGTKANGADVRLANLFKRNNVTDNYIFNRDANDIWGIKPDYTFKVQSQQYSDIVTTVNLFKSKDGNIYTALASNSNVGHDVIASAYHAAWNFIKHFSRNADGSIKITGTIPTK